MYILVWTTRKNDKFNSYWEAHDDLELAQTLYDELLDNEAVYTASLCKPIQSTDYDIEV